ncbi:MAG TPA: SET domain-containing protein-lysine N-methyltransferase [Pyrinomonadaceae bacterium]|jgi:SET domain-containing protein
MRNTFIVVPVFGGTDAGKPESLKIEIREKNGFRGVFAKEEIAMNSVIKLEGVITSHPTRHSIQLGEDKHLSVPPDQEVTQNQNFFWKYLNHSCQPNSEINTASVTFRPLRKIGQGEECTFNYLTTEYEMAAPFTCNCGAANCFGLIRGYKYLSAEQREELTAHARTVIVMPEPSS